MNKNDTFSSPDDDYVETDNLGMGPTSKRRPDDYDDDYDDDVYVNTTDVDERQTSKQCAEDDDDNDYINTKDLYKCPVANQSPDVSAHTELKVIQRAPASSNGRLKILLMILVLLLLGTLAALCALVILYLRNVASFHTLHEKYSNATAIIKLQEATATCEEGWRSLGLKCYFFSDDRLNWLESRDSCVKKGADLVIITSKKKQDFLSEEANETSWIGLNDRETEGKWMWVNKQTLEEMGVTFWYQRTEGKSEPDNSKMDDTKGENCASLGNSTGNIHKWFDGSCNKNKTYICEK